MERNYFICSVGDPDDVYDTDNLTRCIVNNCFVLNPIGSHHGCIEQIKEGDILLLKYQHHFIAYGRAISSLKTDKDISDGEGWTYRVEVNMWLKGNHAHKYGIQAAQEGGTAYDTVKKVERLFALGKIEEIGLFF